MDASTGPSGRRSPAHLTPARAFLIVLLPFSGGYFLSYLFRTVNSVIGDDLIRDLSLSASDIGLLTAAYLLTFALFQLPLGVLLDRFGPRRVQSVLLVIAGTGALVFAIGQDKETLIAGRALIGLGVAGALMASLKAITQWFPRERWPLVNGCFLAIGGLGAVASTTPVQAALAITDWRGIFLVLAALTVVVAAAIFTIVPDKREETPPARIADQIRGLKHIYGSRVFWSLAPLIIGTGAANLAIQGLWAGLWLRDVGGLGRNEAAFVLALLNIGMTAGFLGIGLLADFVRRFGIRVEQVMNGCVAMFLLAQLGIVLTVSLPGIWLWIIFGFFANSTILAYPLIAGHFPLAYAGRANTAVNLASFAGAFVAQYALGGIIDLFPRAPDGNYIPSAYEAAFGAILVVQIAALFWFLYSYRRVRAEQATATRTPETRP